MAKTPDRLYLEFGTGQFRACVLSVNALQAPEMHLFSVESAGIRRGDIHDSAAALKALEGLVHKLETAGFDHFRSCELLIPGSMTSSRVVSSELSLHGLSVAKEHIDNLSEDLMNQSSEHNAEVIDFHVQYWSCDSVQSSHQPLGAKGTTLTAHGFSQLMERSALGRVISLCNQCGFEVSATHSSIVAATRLIERLSPEASNRVVIDFGHSSTTGMIVVGHRANAAFSVRAGAHHITKDVAAAFSCGFAAAESMKRALGLKIHAAGTPLLTGSSAASQNGSASAPSPETIFPWAAPRVAEIFALCFRQFAIYSKALDGGLVLIGGGSQTQEICSFVSHKLGGLKVTRFKPSKDTLTQALGISVYHGDDVDLVGFEGLLEVGSQAWKARLRSTGKPSLSHKAPTFLRPILSWFTDLSK